MQKPGMHDSFDPEPIRELPADEPRTPLWLTGLGVALLLLVAVWWVGGAVKP